jgi:capsular polysaccharide biosynthesis protein
MIFKIKLEDKAALLNRMEKADDELSSNQIKDNKAEGYFELTVTDPKQLEIVKSILNKSPKINTIKEMKKSLTKNELKEMIRQELNEKKKVEDKKKKLDEVVGGLDDPNFIAGVATLLGVSAAVLTPFIKALRSAKSPEEKAKVKNDLKNAIGNKMSGGM